MSSTPLLLLIASTVALLLGLFVTWLIHSRVTMQIKVTPGARLPAGPYPLISVIVPARNEARNIRRCIEALLSQDYPNFELSVLDDHSTDDTPRILAEMSQSDHRLRVLHGADLPEGWAGKPHALAQAAAQSKGEWLCFIDADTFAHPKLLSTTYEAAIQNQADLFTILTEQELGTFWERVVLPLVFTALSFGFPAERVNDPRRKDAIANGQFILVRRPVYQAVGGHAAVRARIDEDKAMAELVKGAGYRLVVADGRLVARTRMYTSLPEIWEGWTKNIYLGLRDRLWLLLFGAVLGLLAALALPVWLFGGLTWLALGGGWAGGLFALQALLLWTYLLWWRFRACRAHQIPLAYAFTLPLGAGLFTAMMFASAFKVLSGRGVRWKGRTYQ
jgi:chlorobactene glucosyltransferase